MVNSKMNLVCYLSNGYPSAEATIENASAYIEGGVDIIEIDLPTGNPYIDGPLLQKRMIKSYNEDTTLQSHIETIYKIRSKFPNQRLIVLAYEESISLIGVERFIKLYNDNGIESLILVNVQSKVISNQLMEEGVKIVSYVRSDMNELDLKQMEEKNGFVYLQAKSGEENFGTVLKENIYNIKNMVLNEREVYCGVGISTPKDIDIAKRSGADGVFVGSAVFTKEDNKNLMIEYIRDLKKYV